MKEEKGSQEIKANEVKKEQGEKWRERRELREKKGCSKTRESRERGE